MSRGNLAPSTDYQYTTRINQEDSDLEWSKRDNFSEQFCILREIKTYWN